MAPEEPHAQLSLPGLPACGPPDAPINSPGDRHAAAPPPVLLRHLPLSPHLSCHTHSTGQVAHTEPAQGPTPQKERRARRGGRPVPDPEGLGLAGRPSHKRPARSPGKNQGPPGRCCLEAGAPDSGTDCWAGLVSQGRAEKGLLGGREVSEAVPWLVSSGHRAKDGVRKGDWRVTTGLKPTEGQRALSPPLVLG